jgi:hypothetical protein
MDLLSRSVISLSLGLVDVVDFLLLLVLAHYLLDLCGHGLVLLANCLHCLQLVLDEVRIGRGLEG